MRWLINLAVLAVIAFPLLSSAQDKKESVPQSPAAEETQISLRSVLVDHRLTVLGVLGDGRTFSWKRDNATTGHISSLREVDENECAALSPDGTMIATADRQQAIGLWELGRRRSYIVGKHEKAVTTVCWSPDSRLVASAGADHIMIWERKTQAFSRQIIGKTRSTFRSLCFSADGKLLLSGLESGGLWFYDFALGMRVAFLTNQRGPVTCLAVGAESTRLAAGSTDKTVSVWDVSTRRQLAIWETSAEVTAVALSSDGNRLATAGADKRVAIWDVASKKSITEIKMNEAGIQLAFRGNNALVLATSRELILWNAQADALGRFPLKLSKAASK